MRAALVKAVGHRWPLLYIRPPRDRRYDRPGICSVCESHTVFTFNSWVVPRDMKDEWSAAGLAHRLAERETMFCRECCASLRVRRLTEVLILHYAETATTATALVGEEQFRALDIAEINGAGALHGVLQRHPRLHYSEFRGGARPGDIVDGVRNEDICELTYADASLDVVVTAETLEHVADYRRALRETRRVLRFGGRHVFTVPAMPSRTETVERARAAEDGVLVHNMRPQYHGRHSGPLGLATRRRRDYLAFHEFGMDLVDELRAAGFRPEVHFYSHSDPGSDAAFVFCATAV
jgi:SAM-dependent methyltransferase